MHMIHLKTNAFSKCRLVRSNCFFYNHSENKSFSSPLLHKKKPNAARFPIVSVDIISPNDNTLVL